MITTYSSRDYRITYQGISLIENALERPDLVQVSVVSGCTIMVAPQKQYGINYLPNGEYRFWYMEGVNTGLARAEAHYIYARLEREGANALLLFSVNNYDIDGKINGAGDASEDYYYIKLGNITATDSVTNPTRDREITIDFGYLSTPAGNDNDWRKLFEVTADDLIRPLKKFTSYIVKGTLSIVGKIVLNNKQVTDISREDDEEGFTESDEILPTTKLLKGKYLKELRKVLLSKDRIDQTNFLLKFGEFIDSMIAGKGAGIFPDGRGQFERLEVRGSLSVLDLIINQIQGMESDYSFTEIGKIESVEDLGENTYRLKIEKRTEYDFTKFQENDVCFSIINTLLTGGSDYYTSWMRILTKNAQENTITVVVYPDSEVPGGKNYPPLAGYNLTRRGNSVLPEEGQINERAQSWMLSSREGRIMFLSNVFKPVLEDYNYSISIGKFPKVKALDKLPISENETGIMAQTIIAEKFYQYDYNGDIVPNKVDRGEWSLSVAQSGAPYRFIQHERTSPSGSEYTLLEQHTVYHLGCKWGCLSDKTTDEPKWNSPSWSLLEGDSRYSLRLSLSGGEAFVVGAVDTVMTANILYGNIDITDDVMELDGAEVEWFRDSGNVPADNNWNPSYVGEGKLSIHIDNSNQHGVGSDFGFTAKSVSFICRVYIPVDGEFRTVEQRFGFDIL